MSYIVQECITQKTPVWIADVYKRFFDVDVVTGENFQLRVTQNVALQLHFDVQFIMQCMTSRDNKDASTSCQQALLFIERHIDPFDLSVFNAYMATNVKRCVLKYQAMYGILIPGDRYTLLTSMKATLPQAPTFSTVHLSGAAGVSGQSSECSIQLSNCTSRFPLLPIASKNSDVSRTGSRQANKNLDSGGKGVKQLASLNNVEQRNSKAESSSQEATPRTRRKREKSPVNKAWSAFEEMSNKWFGTGK